MTCAGIPSDLIERPLFLLRLYLHVVRSMQITVYFSSPKRSSWSPQSRAIVRSQDFHTLCGEHHPDLLFYNILRLNTSLRHVALNSTCADFRYTHIIRSQVRPSLNQTAQAPRPEPTPEFAASIVASGHRITPPRFCLPTVEHLRLPIDTRIILKCAKVILSQVRKHSRHASTCLHRRHHTSVRRCKRRKPLCLLGRNSL
jgi:hypothetical protein